MDRSVRAPKYPHFMEKTHLPPERTYKSERILGQLFDMVDRVLFTPKYELPFDNRILGAYHLEEEVLRKALDIKCQYDMSMRRIMAQHDIKTEFEVWSTFVLSHNRESSNYKFAEIIGTTKAILVERHQDLCINEAGGPEFEVLGPFIAAMYTVTAREVEQALSDQKRRGSSHFDEKQERTAEKKMPLMSFPWIFEHELGRIANGSLFGSFGGTITDTFSKARNAKNPRYTRTADQNLGVNKSMAHIGSDRQKGENEDNVTAPEEQELKERLRSLNLRQKDQSAAAQASDKPKIQNAEHGNASQPDSDVDVEMKSEGTDRQFFNVDESLGIQNDQADNASLSTAQSNTQVGANAYIATVRSADIADSAQVLSDEDEDYDMEMPDSGHASSLDKLVNLLS